MPQMKTKTPEKELNEIEVANLSDAEFKTLVIRMLRDLLQHGNNIKEEMKVALSEIKKTPRGTNSEGKEAGIQVSNLEHKEEIYTQLEQNEERKKQTKKDNIRHWAISKNAKSQGCQKEKRKDKKLKTYLKKIMKENFPNLMKEIDIQVQEAQRVPNKLDPKRITLRHILIKMTKVKDKERILKTAIKNQRVT